jgi:hypothetical protein
MATEEQKKIRQLRVFNDIVAGFGEGLYDLFGDTAIATIDSIGEDILEEMEHELGLEIHGEDPQDILTEIERLLVDEYGFLKKAKLEMHPETHEIDMICEGCLMWRATKALSARGVPPYVCVPMMMASAALHKRLGKKAKFVKIDQTDEGHICDIDFHLLD